MRLNKQVSAVSLYLFFSLTFILISFLDFGRWSSTACWSKMYVYFKPSLHIMSDKIMASILLASIYYLRVSPAKTS